MTTPAVPPRRPGWQRFLIGFGAVIVSFAGLFALVWRLTAGLATTADEFFLALKAEDFAKARTYLAEDFRAATSEQELREFVSRSALANYAGASWSTRSIQNSTGMLEGVIETASGGSIPMSISLVREHDAWKIYTLRKLDAGLQSLQSGPTPSVAEQVRLVRATTHDFADAVARKDFTAFHANTATVLQQQFTAAELQKAMQSFIDTRRGFPPPGSDAAGHQFGKPGRRWRARARRHLRDDAELLHLSQSLPVRRRRLEADQHQLQDR